MSHFLRQLSLKQRPPADDEEAEPELSLLESIDALNSRNQQIRERYARLLLRCAAAKSRDSVMLTAAGGIGDSFLNAVDGTNRRPSDRLAAEEGDLDAPLRNLVLTAPPSGNAAHYLARAMVLRFASLLDAAERPEALETLESALNTSALGALAAAALSDGQTADRKAKRSGKKTVYWAITGRRRPNGGARQLRALGVAAAERLSELSSSICLQKGRPNESELIIVSLSAVFSVLLELNRRDPALCVQALQSLLGLLQNLPPETFGPQSYSMILQMHNPLKALRLEGNAQVSECANACMVSLATAVGTPELIFATIAVLFCESNRNVPFNQPLGNCNVLPRNFQRLALTVQRTIQRGPLLMSRNTKFHWWSRPLTDHSPICEFELVFPGCLSPSDMFENQQTSAVQGSICSDGSYVYILSVYGLFKMGSGLTETRPGKVFAHNETLRYLDDSLLIYCNESLYLRRSHSTRLWVIERESLREIGEIMLPTALCEGVLYSDGRLFFHGVLDDQWNFVATPLDDNFAPMQAARSHQRVACRLVDIEYTTFGDFGPKLHALLDLVPSSLKSTAVDLQFGGAVGFLLTRNGKVFYAGNGEAFGLANSLDAWIPLQTAESIVSFVLDVHSNCLVMRAGSGHLYALGSLTNIFDGQPRTPSAAGTSQRIRKIRIPNKRKCTSIAGCGGAMAFAVESGECFLHGRHIVNAHAEIYAAFGPDRVAVASVGLGKTHLVVISRSGLVYTAGLNNLSQCGRSSEGTAEGPRVARSFSPQVGPLRSDSPSAAWCPNSLGHMFVNDVATICARCGCCSAKGRECPYAGRSAAAPSSANQTPVRPPIHRGAPCACGAGETACLRCGICRRCSQQQQPPASTSPIALLPVEDEEEAEEETSDEAEQLGNQNETAAQEPPVPSADRTPRLATDAMLTAGRVVLTSEQNEIKVATVSVFTFGSNVSGQLGVGDTAKRTGPQRVNLPANLQVVQAVAGGNHCVLRTVNGEVLTFGAHRAGQLGRKEANEAEDRFWFARPESVAGFGPNGDRVATWIAAKGDRTFVQSHRRLFTRPDLDACGVAANRECVALIPTMRTEEEGGTPTNCALIPSRPSSSNSAAFRQFPVDFTSASSWAFDPVYDILWSFDADRLQVVGFSDAPRSASAASEMADVELEPPFFRAERRLLQSTELCVPAVAAGDSDGTGAKFTDAQLAVFMLSTAYGLSLSALAVIPTALRGVSGTNKTAIGMNTSANPSLVGALDVAPSDGKPRSRGASLVDAVASSCSVVGRFEAFGGGWGYSAHCVEAIEFRVNRDVALFGLGLFGGRGENTARVKIFRRPSAHDAASSESEHQLELLAETPETLFECAAREVAFVGFPNGASASIAAHVWHVAWVQIHGTSSDCGAEGQAAVRADGDVEWHFRNSPLSNNGTDVESGQLPEFFYKVRPSFAANNPAGHFDASRLSIGSDLGPIGGEFGRPDLSDVSLSAQTVFAVTPAALRHLFRVLEWAIRGSFLLRDYDEMQDDQAATRQERAAFVAVITLRMIRIYFGVLFSGQSIQRYPAGERDQMLESVECVVEFHSLLDRLFQVADEKLFFEDRIGALMVAEAVEVAVACSHLFVPTAAVLAVRLGDSIAKCERNWRLLAMLRSFCRLEGFVLPILGIQQNPPPSSLSTAETRRLAERFAAMVPEYARPATASGVIRFVFELAFAPMEAKPDDLLFDRLRSTAQDLVLRMAKQLVFHRTQTKQPPTIFQTPRRFRQVIAHADWDTGQEHDAIAFKVDRSGVVLHGIGMFAAAAQRAQRKSAYVIEQQEETNRLFLLMVRLLSTKLSVLITSNSLRDGADCRATCSQMVALISVFISAHPRSAFEVVAAFDGVLPLISAANADVAENAAADETSGGAQRKASFGSMVNEQSACSTRTTGRIQAVVESAHPYAPHSLQTHVVRFDRHVEFVCVRFHDECQTAHSEDALWVYGQLGDEGTGATAALYPVGRFSVAKEWPDGVLLVPGRAVWFVFESGAARDEMDVAKVGTRSLLLSIDLFVQQYGFRCTVDGISAVHSGAGLPLQFLADFISASSETDGGLLAQALIVDPFVDVARCRTEVDGGEFAVGRPVNLKVDLRTQFDDRVLKAPAELQVEFVVRRGALAARSPVRTDSARILRSLTVFNDLVACEQPGRRREGGRMRRKCGDDSANCRCQLQNEEYRPLTINQSRFIAITAQPPFAAHSLEEMRWAFELGNATTEVLKLPTNATHTTWTPSSPGRYHVEVRVDGFPIALAALVVPPTPVHRPRQRNLSAVDNSGQQSPFGRPNARAQAPPAVLINRATCPTVSAYAGARIRSHPTLSATIIGGLPRGATIKYVETQRNGDGVWIRLSDDVRSLYVDRRAGAESAWVLQFNRHLKMEHLQMQVVNGNNVDEESKEAADDPRLPAATLRPTTPQRRTRQPSGSTIAEEVDAEEDDEGNTPTDVLRPLTVDCFRAVFAAFVWHEQLVSTLTDCIRELRASNAEGLTPTAAEIRDSFYDSTPSAAFSTLQHARRFRRAAAASWTIDLHPTGGTLTPQSSVLSGGTATTSTHPPAHSAVVAQQSHTSDPGVSLAQPTASRVPTSLSASANVLRRPTANFLSTVGPLAEEEAEDEGLLPFGLPGTSANARLAELPLRLSALIGSSPSAALPTAALRSFRSPQPTNIGDLHFATRLRLLPHPWRLCFLAGDLVNKQMVQGMHSFLQTLWPWWYIILRADEVDIRLKCLCFRAWTFQLTVCEQNLLYTLCKLLCSDMNHVSNLTVSWEPRLCTPTILALYVDQVRDSSYRLQQVIVTPGERLEESAELKSLHSTIRFVGWICCCTIGCSSLSITLKFNGRSCRVRQLLLLGYDHAPSTNERSPVHAPNAAVELPEGKSGRPTSAHQLSFTSAQMDAFALFQAVAAQAFSDEFAEEQNGNPSAAREIVNLRDRKKRNFSYVCGLMVMLMKICESRKGLEVFSMRTGLLIMLSELLLFAPQIVQFQTITLQIKDKISHKVSSASLLTFTTDIPNVWRADRPISAEVVQLVLRTLSSVANGAATAQWTSAVRSGFWLSVSALAAVGDPAWLEMSTVWRSLKARRSKEPEPLCENHDDGILFNCSKLSGIVELGGRSAHAAAAASEPPRYGECREFLKDACTKVLPCGHWCPGIRDEVQCLPCFQCPTAGLLRVVTSINALESSTYDPDELICGACSDIAGAPVCGRHGTEFLEYKCKFCCSVAVYFCFGTSHFCGACHSDFQRLMSLPAHLLPKCPVGPRATPLEGAPQCPLRVQHPPTGQEFSLGCGICRNLTTF
ncbi:RCR-type E3 ubiquitin transferase [Aphelenchoides fujianensis]|nr:RCR-type E3 ubiquitin transferase [Aphelenchoides fujianensis]